MTSNKENSERTLSMEDLEKMSIEEIFDEYNKKSLILHKNINEINDLLQDSTGMSPKAMNDYINNPQNFTPKQWKDLQAEKEKYRNKLKALYAKLGIDYDSEEKKKENKKASRKKHKSVGMRKKGWMRIE